MSTSWAGSDKDELDKLEVGVRMVLQSKLMKT